MNRQKDYGVKSQLNLRIVIGLYRSYFQIHRSTQKLMASYHLTVSQFGVLEALYHLGPMKIGDLIAKVLSTSGNMTVVIKNLEKDGWINRYFDPTDRRVCLIQLTEKGNHIIKTIFPDHLKNLEKMLNNLDATEKEELIQLFKKLNSV